MSIGLWTSVKLMNIDEGIMVIVIFEFTRRKNTFLRQKHVSIFRIYFVRCCKRNEKIVDLIVLICTSRQVRRASGTNRWRQTFSLRHVPIRQTFEQKSTKLISIIIALCFLNFNLSFYITGYTKATHKVNIV